MKWVTVVLMAMVFLCLSACAPKATQKSVSSTPKTEKVILTDAGKTLSVGVASENVREKPNGKILGKLRKGNQVNVLKRVGNWINFKNDRFENAYIWAPSVGYTYDNLYAPDFFFDDARGRFHSVEHFQAAFSQKGQRRQDIKTAYELFFKNIGLGSHDAVVLEVVTESQQIVEHGITLYINQKTERVEKVRVDYYRPVKGYKEALKKSGLAGREPNESNNGHMLWSEGTIHPKLIIDLERKEWDSDSFSSIWYITPGVD